VKLSELLAAASIKPVNGCSGLDWGAANPEIRSVHYNSRSVSPGGLFVAIPGHQADGHSFVGDAVARGAAAAVMERPIDADVPRVCVKDSRQALALLSAGFYGYPSRRLSLIGITGTNGKTTTTYLVESMLKCAGRNPGVIGTVNFRYAGKVFDNSVTTPESLDLQRILFEMIEANVTDVVMEVSSHAIDLSRIKGCDFDVAAFTNLTQDHLDYHGTIENYWRCKQRLFTEYLPESGKKNQAVAVINVGNAYGKDLAALLRRTLPDLSMLTYGRDDNEPHTHPSRFVLDGNGVQGEIKTPVGHFEFRSALVGRHNLENILCATGIGIAIGLPLGAIRDGIASLSKVPGRLEPVVDAAGRFIFVDYAHTPDALENVLNALAALKGKGRLVCIFGCGGDRDRAKRPLMGKIATGLADLTIVTSDNPRTEDPEQIIAEIISGVSPENVPALSSISAMDRQNAKGYCVVPDRKDAIRVGLSASIRGDILLIAGKGHETYQILGTRKVPFDDRTETAIGLSELQGWD
jgi:UDP-N-acetylmuramoyl-L-alanyl-D-glutamate--2,6-diaminopimelate ligase